MPVEFCGTHQEKRTPKSQLAADGCCEDFANPCKVPVFPTDIDSYRTDTLRDYGVHGLFWPFGGAGFFISAGLAVDVVGPKGWALCARMFVKMSTDVQVNADRWYAQRFQSTTAVGGLIGC